MRKRSILFAFNMKQNILIYFLLIFEIIIILINFNNFHHVISISCYSINFDYKY